MQHHIRADRVRRLAAAAALGASAFALAASPADAAVTAGREVGVAHGSNLVLLAGYADATDVRVLRDGVQIGEAADKNNVEGEIALNHGADECFDDRTPDIIPGDVIEVTNGGNAADVDTMEVEAVEVDWDAASLDGLTYTFGGSVPEAAEYGFRIVFDTADRFDAALDLPAGAFSRSMTLSGPQAAELDTAETSLELIGGDNENEITVSDPESTTAAPDCPTLERSALDGVSDTLVNADEAADGVGTTLSGMAAPDTTVTATVNGQTFESASTGAQRDWTLNIPTSALNEGPTNEVVVSYARAGGGEPPAESPVNIAVDTVAPGALTANPAPGTYVGGRTVSLQGAEAGSTIRYTTDGADPTAASALWGGSLDVDSSMTFKARQFDAAGNPGPVGTYAYTINAPQPQPQQPAQQQPAPAPAPIVVLQQQPPVATPSVAVAARTLRARGSRKLRTVRRRGLGYRVNVSSSTRFLLVRLTRVVRKRGKTRRIVVAEREVSVTRSGVYRGRLRVAKRRLKAGRYQLAVAPAGADQAYADGLRTTLRIKR